MLVGLVLRRDNDLDEDVLAPVSVLNLRRGGVCGGCRISNDARTTSELNLSSHNSDKTHSTSSRITAARRNRPNYALSARITDPTPVQPSLFVTNP
jgi:hypothetical protein